LKEEGKVMNRRRISIQLKQGAFLGGTILILTQSYAFRELLFLGILFSVAFWLVAGVVCGGVVIYEGVHATFAWIGSHTVFAKGSFEPPITPGHTVQIAGVKRGVE
jgi:hypothetical protein